MSNAANQSSANHKGVYHAPWEKAFDRVLTPLEDFIHRQTTSGILLMLCAIAALYVANSQWNEAYHRYCQVTENRGKKPFHRSGTTSPIHTLQAQSQ